MFRHILVPIDLSARADCLLAVARALAEPARARVTILHAIQRIEGIAPKELARFYRQLEKRAQDKVGRACRKLARAGLKVDGVVLIGEPPKEILAHATSKKADLIVIGSYRVHRRTPAYRLGMTSYRVALLSPCPVLLVK
ncbi:MAG: universal stress protein [Candidatus Binatia bacterium]